MKKFSFNKILIIESINPNQKELYEVGYDLKQKIDDQISKLQIANKDMQSFTCDLTQIQSLNDWDELWVNLKNDAKLGCRPIIHFVCHGSKDGLCIWDRTIYKTLDWKRVLGKISSVNIETRNNIFVTMCVCQGFYSLMNLFSDEIIPFFGLISTTHFMYAYQADISYPEFYASLLSKQNLAEAYKRICSQIESIRKNVKDDKVDIQLSFTDDLFVKSFRADIQKRKDLGIARAEALKFIEEDPTTKNLSSEEKSNLVERFLKEYENNISDVYLKMRDKKFMLDKYPEDIDRYDFPDDIKKDD